jgi:signal peptidase I
VNWRRALRLFIWIALVCGVLVGVLFIFFEAWTVPGDDAQFGVSIEPTMSVGDIVLVSRSSGGGDGALVRCTDPDSVGRFVVGRIVGEPGDTVEFSSGTLLVNNKTPTASAACDPPVYHLKNPANQEEEELSCSLEELGGSTHSALRSAKVIPGKESKVEVEAGKVYLVSDNRALHLDSRDFNMVSPSTCHRIALRLWGLTGWTDAKRRLTVLW